MADLVELEDIHSQISAPVGIEAKNIYHVRGKYKYYHYKCDGFDDCGWGCGYRTTQTICSWLRGQKLLDTSSSSKLVSDVPSVVEMQSILAKSGDKPTSFVGSHDWIGCVEASIVVDTLYDVPCRIVHCESGKLIGKVVDLIREHFETVSAPVMMGGDVDSASKCVLALAFDENKRDNIYLLIADPHLVKKTTNIDRQLLLADNWISWRHVDSFENASFYNFCMPIKRK